MPFGQLPLDEVTSVAMMGRRHTVRDGLQNFIAATHPDELMILSQIYDHAARLRSVPS